MKRRDEERVQRPSRVQTAPEGVQRANLGAPPYNMISEGPPRDGFHYAFDTLALRHKALMPANSQLREVSIDRLGTAGVAVFLGLGTLSAQSTVVSFEKDVFPILQRRCVVCHQGDTAQKGLRLTGVNAILAGGESGSAVVAGKPAASLLLTKVQGEKPAMPPVGDPLSHAEVEIIAAWIEAGAVDDSAKGAAEHDGTWWSLRPFQPANPPAVQYSWASGEIDQFVLAKMREKGLTPSKTADRRTLIRRLKFDLLGLPPTPEGGVPPG